MWGKVMLKSSGREEWVRTGHSEYAGQACEQPAPGHQKAKQRSLGWPTRSRLGRQAYWIMGGGPHISISGSSSGGGGPDHLFIYEALAVVPGFRGFVHCVPELERAECSFRSSSSSGRSRMSFSVWLANSRWHTVGSCGSLMMARITCSIGVMPVPPAIMPTDFTVLMMGWTSCLDGWQTFLCPGKPAVHLGPGTQWCLQSSCFPGTGTSSLQQETWDGCL